MPVGVAVLFLLAAIVEGASRGIRWAINRNQTPKVMFAYGVEITVLGIVLGIILGSSFEGSVVLDILEAVFGVSLTGWGIGLLVAAGNLWLMQRRLVAGVLFPPPSESLFEAAGAFIKAVRDYFRKPPQIH